MKVSELIELLKEVDSDKVIYGWYDGWLGEVLDVDELTDRVDLNINLEA